MLTALNVANYFLARVDREAGDLITQLKLYKLVYYAQAWNLVFYGEALFNDEIQAWKHGPVPISLRSTFKDYESQAIPAPEGSSLNEVFTNDQLAILDLVWRTYGEMSASRISRLTHTEKPWLLARGNAKDNEHSDAVISTESIQDFYRDYGGRKNGSLIIDDCIFNEDIDDPQGTLFLKGGHKVQVRLSDLGAYLNDPSVEVEAQKTQLRIPC